MWKIHLLYAPFAKQCNLAADQKICHCAGNNVSQLTNGNTKVISYLVPENKFSNTVTLSHIQWQWQQKSMPKKNKLKKQKHTLLIHINQSEHKHCILTVR